jgi:hypothetical protein
VAEVERQGPARDGQRGHEVEHGAAKLSEAFDEGFALERVLFVFDTVVRDQDAKGVFVYQGHSLG